LAKDQQATSAGLPLSPNVIFWGSLTIRDDSAGEEGGQVSVIRADRQDARPRKIAARTQFKRRQVPVQGLRRRRVLRKGMLPEPFAQLFARALHLDLSGGRPTYL